MKTGLFFLIFFLQLTYSTIVNSEIYKSIDEHGRVTYSKKPASDNAEKVKIKKTPKQNPVSKERIEKQQKLLNALQDERDQKIVLEQEEREKAAEKQLLCEKTRKRLQEYREAGFLYKKTDDPDNPIIATDEERNEAERKLENLIKENC